MVSHYSTHRQDNENIMERERQFQPWLFVEQMLRPMCVCVWLQNGSRGLVGLGFEWIPVQKWDKCRWLFRLRSQWTKCDLYLIQDHIRKLFTVKC